MPSGAAPLEPTSSTTLPTLLPAAAKRGCTPHVAQNDSSRRSAIDRRTTRHPGYTISMIKRKRIEEPFGWIKTIGGLRKTRHRGRDLVEWFSARIEPHSFAFLQISSSSRL